MVKLSRRGASNGRKGARKSVRKSKRSSSRKYRKAMKGGVFTNKPGLFIRKSGFMSGNKTLYQLEYIVDGTNNVYILDFTKSNIGGILSRIMTADKFSKVLKEALNSSDTDDNNNIAKIIFALFEGGSDGAKTRMLKITEPASESASGPVTIDLTLASDNSNIMSVIVNSAKGKMGNFLVTLGDDINEVS